MMTSLPVRRRALGRWLLELREATGLSVADAARKLGLSRTALDGMEHGTTALSPTVVESVLRVYDHASPDLPELVRHAQEPGWWGGYHLDGVHAAYLAWETSASKILYVATTSIPDLLRNQPYQQAYLQNDPPRGRNNAQVRQWIEHGMRAVWLRQLRLADEPPSRLGVVITEAALFREITGRQVMVAQWLHLITAAQWPAVELRVLPEAVAPSDLVGFRLLEFTDPQEPARLFPERLGGALNGTVATAAVTWARERYRALVELCDANPPEQVITDAASGDGSSQDSAGVSS